MENNMNNFKRLITYITALVAFTIGCHFSIVDGNGGYAFGGFFLGALTLVTNAIVDGIESDNQVKKCKGKQCH